MVVFFLFLFFFEWERETIYCQLRGAARLIAQLKPEQILRLPLGDSLILCTLGLWDFVNKQHKFSERVSWVCLMHRKLVFPTDEYWFVIFFFFLRGEIVLCLWNGKLLIRLL